MTKEPTVFSRHVAKRYGPVEAVRDVSLDARGGECLALVGHNGAGKTTMIKLMLGLITRTSGDITVLGEDPASGSAALRSQIGFLPENLAFNPALTGREVLDFFARLKRQSHAEVERLLKLVGLEAASTRRVGTYSKGMRQRLGLAQALLGGPRLLLLDEPTTGLDPALRRSFYRIVHELARAGATVIISSHALAELEDFADRVLILDRGRVLANGSLEELRNIAQLPVRLRLRLGNGAPPEWLYRDGHAVEGGWWELSCGLDQKMDVLRQAAAANGAIRDIEISMPSLDEVYAHFLESGAAVS